MIQLPGGIKIENCLKRDFSFKPVTGLLELELSESVVRALHHPDLTHSENVTNILCEALEMLAGETVTKERVKALCVGDRQFLMRHLAIHIDDALVWLAAKCGECGESFDVSLRYSELPVKPAGEKFPETYVETNIGQLKVRVPNGKDQEILAVINNDSEAMHVLLKRLVSQACKNSSEVDSTIDFDRLSEAQIALIEETVEQMAPEVATEVLAECPNCSVDNRVPVNPYSCMERSGDELFFEIHALASCYH